MRLREIDRRGSARRSPRPDPPRNRASWQVVCHARNYFSDPPSPPPSAPAPNSSKVEKLSAAVTVGTAAALANPLVAEAAVTPSLKNTLLSVVAGGLVLGAIAAAVIGVSTFDKVNRK